MRFCVAGGAAAKRTTEAPPPPKGPPGEARSEARWGQWQKNNAGGAGAASSAKG